MHTLKHLSQPLTLEAIRELRLRRHSSKKRSNRKAVSNIKEAILALTDDERKDLKGLLG